MAKYLMTIGGVMDLYEVKMISSEERQKRRKEYKSRKMSIVPSSEKENYNTHHIIPLQLGGLNVYDNLIIMDKTEHNFIHTYIIDPQIKDKNVGQKFVLAIPCMKGLKRYSMKTPEFYKFLQMFKKRYPYLDTYVLDMYYQHER